MHDGTILTTEMLGQLRTGRLAGAAEDGRHLVEAGDDPVPARSLVPIRPQDRGREVAFAMTAEGEALILGLIQLPSAPAEGVEDEMRIDGKKKLKLTCGAASITLFPDGRVVIRGTQILSRSEGANRILGASVHLN